MQVQAASTLQDVPCKGREGGGSAERQSRGPSCSRPPAQAMQFATPPEKQAPFFHCHFLLLSPATSAPTCTAETAICRRLWPAWGSGSDCVGFGPELRHVTLSDDSDELPRKHRRLDFSGSGGSSAPIPRSILSSEKKLRVDRDAGWGRRYMRSGETQAETGR